VRRVEGIEREAPIPPPLPPGRVVLVPGRGEVFVREQAGPVGAPTILLLHGFTASADLNWWAAYGALGEVGRVLAVDHRGHGRGLRSEQRYTLEAAADDAAGLLEALGVRSAIVVGYSMGGPISMLLWQRHPHLVDGLVLEATALEWRSTRRERWMWELIGVIEWFFRSRLSSSMIDRWLRDAIAMQPELAAHRAWFKAEIGRGDPRELGEAGHAIGEFDARAFAGDIDVPVAVVVTTKDRLVRPRKQRALARATRAQVLELAGDHDVCFVDGRSFAAVTTDAVRAVAGEQASPVRLVADGTT
jgi:pimeloyl-ACP methyl ester carboxylesterase